MEFDKLPSKPIVKSMSSAQAEWDQWLASNLFEYVRDADGLDWRVAMNFEQLPGKVDARASRWITTLEITANVQASRLVETGTMDAVQDERLILLAGERLIPLRMKKLQYEATGEKEMRDILSRVLPELRENFRKTSLHEVKKALFGRWIDGLTLFGGGMPHADLMPNSAASRDDF